VENSMQKAVRRPISFQQHKFCTKIFLINLDAVSMDVFYPLLSFSLETPQTHGNYLSGEPQLVVAYWVKSVKTSQDLATLTLPWHLTRPSDSPKSR
jgi:hypothetical protein